MSDKETPREDSATPVTGAEAAAKNAQPAEEGKRKPEQALGRYLDFYKQSLTDEGEKANQRWGLPLFHSLSDEEAEAQRAMLGIAPKDALDYFNRGCLLAQREDFAGAIKAFDQAILRDAQLRDAWYNRALTLEKLGDANGARQAWRAYMENFGDSEDADAVKQHLESLAQAS